MGLFWSQRIKNCPGTFFVPMYQSKSHGIKSSYKLVTIKNLQLLPFCYRLEPMLNYTLLKKTQIEPLKKLKKNKKNFLKKGIFNISIEYTVI